MNLAKQPAHHIAWYFGVGRACDVIVSTVTNLPHCLTFGGEKTCEMIVWTVNNSIVYIDFHPKNYSFHEILARSRFFQNAIYRAHPFA